VNVPTIIVADESILAPAPVVYFDDIQTGYLAGRHAIEQGYRRIVFVSPFTDAWVANRLAGVRHAASERGREPGLRVFIDDSAAPGAKLQKEMALDYAPRVLTSDVRGAAIVCANDNVARGLSQAADELGWECGRDYGLIGFDDIRWAREVGVTSVHPPIERMGREAVRLLMSILRGGTSQSADHIRIPSYLIPRESTTRADGDATRGTVYE